MNRLVFYAIFFVWVLGLVDCPTISAAPAVSLSPQELRQVEQGEIIVRELTKKQNPGRTFEVVGLIGAPLELVAKVLTDYARYPEFMPNVSTVEILEQDDQTVLLNYVLSLPLGKIKKYRLRLAKVVSHPQEALIQWHLEPWPELSPDETIKDTTGYWSLREKSPNKVLVVYHVYTDPGPIPLGLGWIVDILSEKSVPEAFAKTKMRAEGLVGP